MKNNISRLYDVYGESIGAMNEYREFAEQHDIDELDRKLTLYALNYNLNDQDQLSEIIAELGENYQEQLALWFEWDNHLGKAIRAIENCDEEAESIYDYLKSISLNALRLPFAKQLIAVACMLLQVAEAVAYELDCYSCRHYRHLDWDDFANLLEQSCLDVCLGEIVQDYCCDW